MNFDITLLVPLPTLLVPLFFPNTSLQFVYHMHYVYEKHITRLYI